jgi:hypothetical protein
VKHRGAYGKKLRNVENIRARHEWLVAALEDPKQVPATLVPYLSSQRRFTQMKVDGTAIRPISLNTLKSIADETLSSEAADGKGFSHLDRLREALQKRLGQRPPDRSIDSQRNRLEALLADNRKALRLTEVSNLQRSQSYVDLYSKMVNLLQSGSLDDVTRLRIHNVLQDHRDLHGSLFSPGSPDNSDAPLRVISGGKA